MFKKVKLQKLYAIILVLCVCATLFAFTPNSEKALAAPSGNMIIFTETLSSANDEFTTAITVDYDLAPLYHMFNIRTGLSGFSVEITDIDSNKNTYVMDGGNATVQTGKQWTPLRNQGNYTGEVTYQIRVTPRNFKDDCSFILIFGIYDEIQQMLSNPSDPNFWMVPASVSRYSFFTPGSSTSMLDNWYSSFFVPVNGERDYFEFVATGSNKDIVAFQTSYQGLRFEVRDKLTGSLVHTSGAHVTDTNFGSMISMIYYTRAALNLTAGRTYRVELYRAPGGNQNSLGYISSTYFLSSNNTWYPSTAGVQVRVTIGGPHLSGWQLSEVYKSTSTLTVTKSAFADRAIPVNNMPISAHVTQITLTYQGSSLSNFDRFRYRPTPSSPWVESAGLMDVFNVPYTYEGTTNRTANGTWSVGYKSWSSTLTITPGFRFKYLYELGNL